MKSKADTNFEKHSEILKDKIILLKDSALTINNNRIVFKGIENTSIYLDFYLLELDPEYAYHKNISKKEAVEGFQLGDYEYQLISVTNAVLKLSKKNY
jgi:hypothetical protein